MADLSNVHHIVIGYDKIEEYNININILRNVFLKGKDLLITAIYNGDHPGLAAQVDNFIALKENKGYVWGAIDAVEKGLNFINTMPFYNSLKFKIQNFCENLRNPFHHQEMTGDK